MRRRVWDVVNLVVAAVVVAVVAMLVFWIIPCPRRPDEDGSMNGCEEDRQEEARSWAPPRHD